MGSPAVLLAMAVVLLVVMGGGEAASWCVARSGASSTALQTGLDYACGAGADCSPIQSSGLCYLPNTLPAHASYAYNSYFQRNNQGPSTCDFSGTATVTVTDPSYGSCTYPSSPSSAGGTTAPSPPNTNTPPFANVPPPPLLSPNFSGGGLTPGFNPTGDTSGAPRPLHALLSASLCLLRLLF